MSVSTNRNYARSYCEANLLFAKGTSGEYSRAKMINCCVDGICFETENELPPGHDVCIKMVNDTPDLEYYPEAYKILRGQVRWCRRTDEPMRYGVGVQFFKTLNRVPV